MSGFLVVLFAYFRTAAPGAWWGDGLELAASTKVLGVPHPTGYPLYMLLGHGVIRALPGLDAGRALTLFSGFLCAFSALIAGWAFRPVPRLSAVDEGIRPVAVGLGLMLLFAFSRTVWEHATFAEVYPLTLILTTGIVALASTALSPTQSGLWRTIVLALLFGLGALNHYSIIAVGPLAFLTVISWAWRGPESGRLSRVAIRFAIFTLVSAVFLIGYLYLPLRAAVNPPINWGNPVDWTGVSWVLRGGGYASSFLADREALFPGIVSGLKLWVTWFGEQFLPASWTALHLLVGLGLISGAVFGSVRILRRSPALGAGLLISILATALLAVFYRIRDPEPYFLPALPAAFLGWTESAGFIVNGSRAGSSAQRSRALLPLLPLVFGLLLFVFHYTAVDKSWDDAPQHWARAVLDAVPENSIVLTQQAKDSEIYALWYEQIVNGYRTDVAVIGTGFIFSGWYRNFFERSGGPPLALFIEDRPPTTKDVFDVALISGIILPNIGKRPVFSTYVDETLRNHLAPQPVAQLLPPSYYEAGAYKLAPPSPWLFELHPEPGLAEIGRAQFIKYFGRDPPAAP